MPKRIVPLVALLALALPSTAAARAPAAANWPTVSARHRCPVVASEGLRSPVSIRLFTHGLSCARALEVARAMISGVGVTFSGDPNDASTFRWTLYGLPGWTCFGDGSGFPEGGAGGICAKGQAVVEWYHTSPASRKAEAKAEAEASQCSFLDAATPALRRVVQHELEAEYHVAIAKPTVRCETGPVRLVVIVHEPSRTIEAVFAYRHGKLVPLRKRQLRSR